MLDVTKLLIDSPDDADIAIVKACKAAFLTEQGQVALEWMLEGLKFLEHCENEQDMALNNFAKDLLVIIYCDEKMQKADTSRIMNYVKKLLRRTK